MDSRTNNIMDTPIAMGGTGTLMIGEDGRLQMIGDDTVIPSKPSAKDQFLVQPNGDGSTSIYMIPSQGPNKGKWFLVVPTGDKKWNITESRKTNLIPITIEAAAHQLNPSVSQSMSNILKNIASQVATSISASSVTTNTSSVSTSATGLCTANNNVRVSTTVSGVCILPRTGTVTPTSITNVTTGNSQKIFSNSQVTEINPAKSLSTTSVPINESTNRLSGSVPILIIPSALPTTSTATSQELWMVPGLNTTQPSSLLTLLPLAQQKPCSSVTTTLKQTSNMLSTPTSQQVPLVTTTVQAQQSPKMSVIGLSQQPPVVIPKVCPSFPLIMPSSSSQMGKDQDITTTQMPVLNNWILPQTKCTSSSTGSTIPVLWNGKNLIINQTLTSDQCSNKPSFISSVTTSEQNLNMVQTSTEPAVSLSSSLKSVSVGTNHVVSSNAPSIPVTVVSDSHSSNFPETLRNTTGVNSGATPMLLFSHSAARKLKPISQAEKSMSALSLLSPKNDSQTTSKQPISTTGHHTGHPHIIYVGKNPSLKNQVNISTGNSLSNVSTNATSALPTVFSVSSSGPIRPTSSPGEGKSIVKNDLTQKAENTPLRVLLRRSSPGSVSDKESPKSKFPAKKSLIIMHPSSDNAQSLQTKSPYVSILKDTKISASDGTIYKTIKGNKAFYFQIRESNSKLPKPTFRKKAVLQMVPRKDHMNSKSTDDRRALNLESIVPSKTLSVPNSPPRYSNTYSWKNDRSVASKTNKLLNIEQDGNNDLPIRIDSVFSLSNEDHKTEEDKTELTNGHEDIVRKSCPTKNIEESENDCRNKESKQWSTDDCAYDFKNNVNGDFRGKDVGGPTCTDVSPKSTLSHTLKEFDHLANFSGVILPDEAITESQIFSPSYVVLDRIRMQGGRMKGVNSQCSKACRQSYLSRKSAIRLKIKKNRKEAPDTNVDKDKVTISPQTEISDKSNCTASTQQTPKKQGIGDKALISQLQSATNVQLQSTVTDPLQPNSVGKIQSHISTRPKQAVSIDAHSSNTKSPGNIANPSGDSSISAMAAPQVSSPNNETSRENTFKYYLIRVDGKSVLVPCVNKTSQPRAFIFNDKKFPLKDLSSTSVEHRELEPLVDIVSKVSKSGSGCSSTITSSDPQKKELVEANIAAGSSESSNCHPPIKSEPKTEGYGDENPTKFSQVKVKQEKIDRGYPDELSWKDPQKNKPSDINVSIGKRANHETKDSGSKEIPAKIQKVVSKEERINTLKELLKQKEKELEDMRKRRIVEQTPVDVDF